MKSSQKFYFAIGLHVGIYCFFYVLFDILSTLDLFSFSLLERKIFKFISYLFIILMIPNCIILAFLIRKLEPLFHEQVKLFYKVIRSVKKIQKIGFVVTLSGVAFCIVFLLLQAYNLLFTSSVYFEVIFDFFVYLGMALILGGALIFVLFFGKEKLKAKSWREIIDDYE